MKDGVWSTHYLRLTPCKILSGVRVQFKNLIYCLIRGIVFQSEHDPKNGTPIDRSVFSDLPVKLGRLSWLVGFLRLYGHLADNVSTGLAM